MQTRANDFWFSYSNTTYAIHELICCLILARIELEIELIFPRFSPFGSEINICPLNK